MPPTKWQKRKLPISRCYMCVTVKFFSLFCVSAYFKTEKPDLDEQRKNRKMKRRMDFLWWLKKRKTLLCFCPQAPPFNYNEKSLECYLPLVPPTPNAHAPHSSHLDRLCMKGSWNKDRSLSSFDILVTILCQLIIIHLHFIIFMLHCFLKNAF